MQQRTTSLALTAVLGAAVLATFGLVNTAASAEAAEPPAYTVQTLHFAVNVGPDQSKPCDIIGDLYTPTTASSSRRVPAILTTNGFGGSKDDQAPLAKMFAADGYAVLSYSGLGFGGSGCQITLDDPDYDGLAGKQLISYLGGSSGIAFKDAEHTVPAPKLTVVERDGTNDPRVGMVGGSYGGGAQFATAAVDPRLDTIVPLITWNDLSYSLAPNNTARLETTRTPAVSTSTSGAIKLVWGAGFSALGVLNGVQNAPADPARLAPCPNFATFVCPALVTGGTTGYFQDDAIANLRHASVASYLPRIKIPVLLGQGENDTLFNLNEAAATYRALRAQGTEVKMIWHSWGHSGGPAPGDIDLGKPNPATQYETGRIANWFAHYLKGSSVGTGPRFAYFRDWVDYSGNAAPAYATSSSFPVGSSRTFALGSNSNLVSGSAATGSAAQSFLTPAAGAPSSLNPLDVLNGYKEVQIPAPQTDLPGTFASWTSPALRKNLDVTGSPKVALTVSAPVAQVGQGAGPAGQLVLFVKVLDVAPDGTASLIRGLEAPVRIPDVSRQFTVTLPAFVHRFEPGHSVRLVVAGGSANYRGGLVANPVTIAAGLGQQLILPVVK